MNEEYHFNVFYEIMVIMKYEFEDVEKSAKEHGYTRKFWHKTKGWI